MEPVALVVDSPACLPSEMVREFSIHVIPVKLVLNGRVYADGIDLTSAQAYDLLKGARRATTASPSVGEFLELFRRLSQESKHILCLTIASKLSVLYSSALQAKEMAQAELPGRVIEVVDTGTAAAGEGLIALEAARAISQGQRLEEVIQVVEGVKAKVNLVFLFETLRYLYRTGRIPKLASQLSTLLPIKPLIGLKEGEVYRLGLARHRKQGIERMIEIVRQGLGMGPGHGAVMHAQALEEAQAFRERLAAKFNWAELWLTDFTPVMGYATGPGVLGLAFYAEGPAS